jgi:hypothetical protein
MYEQGPKGSSHDKSSAKAGAKAGAPEEAERRIGDRHIFTASAEVVELGSGARFSTRTTDLGPGGCFVDTMVPFPVGAEVRVTVRRGKTQFETDGVVVYSQSGLGMGIAFETMGLEQREALDVWLADLTGSMQAHTHEPGRAIEHNTAKSGRTHALVVRLVQLMIGKGMITEAEGASVLHDPVL